MGEEKYRQLWMFGEEAFYLISNDCVCLVSGAKKQRLSGT